MKRLTILAFSLSAAVLCGSALAVDKAAGARLFKAQCAGCHYVDDFAGESASNLIVLITQDSTLAAHEGKAKLPVLTPEQVLDLAEYLAAGQ